MAKSEDELKDVERQWDQFQSTFEAPEALNDDQLKKAVIEDLTNVSAMTVEEYTLYQKWLEIHIKYPTQYNSMYDEHVLEDGYQAIEIEKIKESFSNEIKAFNEQKVDQIILKNTQKLIRKKFLI